MIWGTTIFGNIHLDKLRFFYVNGIQVYSVNSKMLFPVYRDLPLWCAFVCVIWFRIKKQLS